MLRRSPRVLLMVWLLATGLTPQTAAGQDRPDVDSWLSRPISPGTVAYLINYPLSEPVLTRLATAMRHSRSDVRAAAARVSFVFGARGLSSVAAEALKTETDLSAAVEQARLVAISAEGDALLLDAWKRLGADFGAEVLLALAGARGPSALRLLPQFRTAGAKESTLAGFIRVATRGEPGATLTLASDALAQRDTALFSAVLTSAVDTRGVMPSYAEELAIKGLAPDVPRDVTFKTIWYVLRTWNAVQPLTALVKSGLEQALDSGHTADQPEELLALELAARATGRPAGTTSGWNDLVARPPAAFRRLLRENAVRARLNDRERETMLDALGIERDQRPAPVAAASTPATTPMRLASDYPIGFMSDLLRTTECNLADAKKTGPGDAVLTLRPDGRVMQVALARTEAPRGCANALRVLMMTHVEPVGRVPPERVRVVTVFDADVVACQDVVVTRPVDIEANETDTPRIQQPKKTRHVAPVYPQSAIDERLQGVVMIESVIAPTGCISRAQVVRPVDVRLDWAALSAVSGWRFTPTLLNGTPVPVIMTVTVQFTLR